MPHPFRFDLVTMGTPSREAWIALAQRAETLGYAALLMPDRPSMGGFAPLTALAVAATVTTRLRVGSYVFANDLRHPALLAKEIATLDVLSGGRVDLGLGAGVGPSDNTQLGIPFDADGVRVSRVIEALTVIKRVFTEDVVDFAGTYYTVKGLKGLPRPMQTPHPPIFVGSSGKRMLSAAARVADIIAPTLKWPRPGAPPDVPLEEKIGWVREAAGDRFDQIRFSQTIYDLVIADSPVPVRDLPGAPPLPKRTLTTDEAIAYLQEQRARYGFSHFQVFEAQLENFAPLVARLSGQ
jgi:probable F420-dependent oxidoreductase